MEGSKSLSEVIANRRWQRCIDPFPHVVVNDVFVPAVADEIDAAVRRIVGDEQLDTMSNYDASGRGFGPDLEWPLKLFVSDPWREFIGRALGVDTIPYISGAVHHHAIGGGDGRPHTDLTPVYFADVEPCDGVVPMRSDLVEFKSGRALQPDVTVRRTVRAVSILYYIANPRWQPGDGGETGLYQRRSDAVDRPAVAVPPLNNSLVAFECTPFSFHSFISNRVSERNSITMWLHRSDTDTVDRWGERALDRWKESPPVPED